MIDRSTNRWSDPGAHVMHTIALEPASVLVFLSSPNGRVPVSVVEHGAR